MSTATQPQKYHACGTATTKSGFTIEWVVANGKVHAWLLDKSGKRCDVEAISSSPIIAVAMVERAIPFH